MNDLFDDVGSELDQGSELKLSAEEFDDVQFPLYHHFSNSDRQILRQLIVHGPVLLRGPRGCGKSAYMREAHRLIKLSGKNVLSAYVSLRYFPLLLAGAREYMGILIPFVAEHVRKELIAQGLSDIDELLAARNEVDLGRCLNDICMGRNSRLVLFFDDVAHIGREASLGGFFDFFRIISSSVVSCKASIYPGVTRFGVRFDLYNDATLVEAQRDERSSDFSDFFLRLLTDRHPEVLSRCESRLREILPYFLGRSVLGNVRAFNALCLYLRRDLGVKSTGSVTVHRLVDGLKWLSSDYLNPAMEELETKLGAYVALLNSAQDLLPLLFGDSASKRCASAVIHRENVQRLGKIFEILEYCGFISKREASKALKTGGRGPRYVLSLGPLIEKLPGGATIVSYELVEHLMRTQDVVEYSSVSSLSEVSFPAHEVDAELGVLEIPILMLKKSKQRPYGLTDGIISSLNQCGYQKISDIANIPESGLMDIPGIAEAKARRIVNAVQQAIWM